MERWKKVQAWVSENAPMLKVLYENKYIAFAYDRFASLPPQRQKRILVITFSGILGAVCFYLMLSYWSLWRNSQLVQEHQELVHLLEKFQNFRRAKSTLAFENQAEAASSLHDIFVSKAKVLGISPKMIHIEEKDSPSQGGITVKAANVTMDKVNLNQLKTFLSSIEFGQSHYFVASIKINNDDKLRGYMKVEMTVHSYSAPPQEDTL